MHYEKKVKEATEKIISTPLEGPVSLRLAFFLHRPKDICWKTKPTPPCYTDKRPDIDNLVKGVVDGLNGVAFVDDKQICHLTATKKYHSGTNKPRVEIEVERIQDEKE